MTVRELYEAAKKASRGWRHRPDGYEEMKAAWARYYQRVEELRLQLPFPTTTEYAYSPQEGASSRGGKHIVVTDEEGVSQGRWKRSSGDPLCKPHGKFWGLSAVSPGSLPDCLACAERAEKIVAEQPKITPQEDSVVRLYRGGGETTRPYTWFTTNLRYAEFFGPVSTTMVDPGRFLDLRQLGVDPSPAELAEEVPGAPPHHHAELYQWAQREDVHRWLRSKGFHGIRLMQWHYDFSEEPQDTFLALGFTKFEADRVLIHLGDLKSPEDARRFLDLAGFLGKDSAREEASKARKAFESLGWAYRTTIGGSVILAEYAGHDANQVAEWNGWVPSRDTTGTRSTLGEMQRLEPTVTLFHGTCPESAQVLMARGWQPNSGYIGGNMGQPRYLYLTNHPANAAWYTEERGCNTVLQVTVPLSQLRVDPEDGSHDTVAEELSWDHDLPGVVVATQALPPSAFTLVDDPTRRPGRNLDGSLRVKATGVRRGRRTSGSQEGYERLYKALHRGSRHTVHPGEGLLASPRIARPDDYHTIAHHFAAASRQQQAAIALRFMRLSIAAIDRVFQAGLATHHSMAYILAYLTATANGEAAPSAGDSTPAVDGALFDLQREVDAYLPEEWLGIGPNEESLDYLAHSPERRVLLVHFQVVGDLLRFTRFRLIESSQTPVMPGPPVYTRALLPAAQGGEWDASLVQQYLWPGELWAGGGQLDIADLGWEPDDAASDWEGLWERGLDEVWKQIHAAAPFLPETPPRETPSRTTGGRDFLQCRAVSADALTKLIQRTFGSTNTRIKSYEELEVSVHLDRYSPEEERKIPRFKRQVNQLGWIFNNMEVYASLASERLNSGFPPAHISLIRRRPQPITSPPPKLYHKTNVRRARSILEHGIKPRRGAGQYKYPPRVYLGATPEHTWSSDPMGLTVLEVDMRKAEVGVFPDPCNPKFWFYTEELIKPEAISFSEGFDPGTTGSRRTQHPVDVRPIPQTELGEARQRFTPIVWPGPKPPVLGAYVGPSLVGVLFADVNSTQEYISFDVGVLPSHQGRGVARALLREFVNDFAANGDRSAYLRAVVAGGALTPALEELGFFVFEEDGDDQVVIYDPHNAASEYQGFYY